MNNIGIIGHTNHPYLGRYQDGVFSMVKYTDGPIVWPDGPWNKYGHAQNEELLQYVFYSIQSLLLFSVTHNRVWLQMQKSRRVHFSVHVAYNYGCDAYV